MYKEPHSVSFSIKKTRSRRTVDGKCIQWSTYMWSVKAVILV
jgi:hypothetical protein